MACCVIFCQLSSTYLKMIFPEYVFQLKLSTFILTDKVFSSFHKQPSFYALFFIQVTLFRAGSTETQRWAPLILACHRESVPASHPPSQHHTPLVQLSWKSLTYEHLKLPEDIWAHAMPENTKSILSCGLSIIYVVSLIVRATCIVYFFV